MTARILAALALIAVLGAAIYFNLSSRQGIPAAPPIAAKPTSEEPIRVVTAKVALETVADTIKSIGTVRSDRQAAITGRVPARIVDILVRDGERVTSGQPLATLDLGDSRSQMKGAAAAFDAARAQLKKAMNGRNAKDVELKSQISQAETGLANAKVKLQQAELGAVLQDSSSKSDVERVRAAVAQAESGVRQAAIALEQAEKTLKRVEFLHSKGGATRVDLEGAKTQAEIAHSQHEAALASLKQAQAAEKPATDAVPIRERVSRQEIKAAQLGVQIAAEALTTARQARTEALQIANGDIEAARAAVRQAEASKEGIGAQIGNATLATPIAGVVTQLTAHQGETAQPGIPLMTVVSTESVYVEASLPVRYSRIIAVGSSARISVDALGHSLSAHVTDLLPVGSDDGRTFPVRLKLSSPSTRLSPGLAVTVTIQPSSSGKSLLVSADAIRVDGDRSYVFVVTNDRAERREVRVESTSGERIVVAGGLSAGDIVVMNPPSSLTSGARIAEAATKN